MKLGELLLLFVAILLPWYLMASKVNSDEIAKTMASVGTTAIVGGYMAWSRKK